MKKIKTTIQESMIAFINDKSIFTHFDTDKTNCLYLQLRFLKYATATLLVSTTTFLIGFTIGDLEITIKIVTSTKKEDVTTMKVAMAYFTN